MNTLKPLHVRSGGAGPALRCLGPGLHPPGAPALEPRAGAVGAGWLKDLLGPLHLCLESWVARSRACPNSRPGGPQPWEKMSPAGAHTPLCAGAGWVVPGCPAPGGSVAGPCSGRQTLWGPRESALGRVRALCRLHAGSGCGPAACVCGGGSGLRSSLLHDLGALLTPLNLASSSVKWS